MFVAADAYVAKLVYISARIIGCVVPIVSVLGDFDGLVNQLGFQCYGRCQTVLRGDWRDDGLYGGHGYRLVIVGSSGIEESWTFSYTYRVACQAF